MNTHDRFLFYFCISFLAIGCSHTIKIKGPRFVSPVVAEKQWGGHVAASAGADTRITLVEDIEDNPPTRGPVLINEDVDPADVYGLNFLSMDAGLSVYDRVELYLDGTTLGLRWQILKKEKWVAAIQYGAVTGGQSSTYEDDTGSETAESEIDQSQFGISVGYNANNSILPYISYLYESYDVETKVTNASGDFGPYKDKGKHQYVALGIMSQGTGFLYGLEYNIIFIDWDRAKENETQNAVGVKLGYAW